MTEEELPSLEMPILKPVMPGATPADDDLTIADAASSSDGATHDDVPHDSADGADHVVGTDSTDDTVPHDGTDAVTTNNAAPSASGDATADPSPVTTEFASTRINASSGRPIAAFLGKGQPAPPQIPLAPMKRMQARFNPLADGMLYLVVFVGGFVGTGLRYGLNLLLPNPAAPSGFFHAFHPSTFIANMCACFIFAALSAYMSQASWIRKRVRELTSRGVGMGMCGGFSTLSAMAIEDLTSVHKGQIAGFLFYTLVSFACGLIVAWIGTKLALSLAAKRSVRALHEQMRRGDGANVVRSTAPEGDYGQPATTLVPSFEPDPVTDEIPMVADPIRGEAHEQ